MLRAALIFQVVIAPLVMGVLTVLALLLPPLGSGLGMWMVLAAVVGFVIAIPISIVAAKSA